MPEVIFTGPGGRIEGRYHPARQKNAPIGIVLHPHPQFGGTMNHQIIYQLYYAFVHRNFSVLRFNFRGVGRSQGSFDHGTGELSDSAAALDWAQTINPEARSCWIAGFSFGAWIGMQLLMRRPEIEGFISIAPPANLYDFSFLAPCPSSGLIIHGDKDAVVPYKDVTGLVDKLKTQKGIVIDQKVVPGANHFFDGKIEPLMTSVCAYLDKRLGSTGRKPSAASSLTRIVRAGGRCRKPALLLLQPGPLVVFAAEVAGLHAGFFLFRAIGLAHDVTSGAVLHLLACRKSFAARALRRRRLRQAAGQKQRRCNQYRFHAALPHRQSLSRLCQ